MASGEVTSWPDMKNNYGKDIEPRRRTVVVDSAVPEFLPEPAVAPVVREKRRGSGSISEFVHSQGGKRKVRENLGSHRSVLWTDSEQGLIHPNKGKDNSRDRQKERRLGKLTRKFVARENEKIFSDSDHDVEVSSEIVETEKPEFQLPSSDLLRLGGIAAVQPQDLFPEMYGKDGGDLEERVNIETRLKRFQEPSFLQIKNKEGKTVEEIIQEYINTIAKFFDEHGKEVKNLGVVLGYTNPEKYLAGYIQFLVRWFPKMYKNSDNYLHDSHDKLLSRLNDGLSKGFQTSISRFFEVEDKSEEITKRKSEMQFFIHKLEREINQIIFQLPSVDESEHRKSA